VHGEGTFHGGQRLVQLAAVRADAHAAVVGRHADHRGAFHAVGGHLRHRVLDPGRPVAHAHVDGQAAAFLQLRRRALRNAQQRRIAADGRVAMGDLVDQRLGRFPPAADVEQVGGDVGQ
jgi:hypothetical protein